MRKIFTVLLMVAMLSMPGNFARANDGGGIVNLNTISAFSRPGAFLTVFLASYVVISTLFLPQISQLPPDRRLRTILALSATLSLAYFHYVLATFTRYFLYSLIFPQSYFQRGPATTTAAATPEANQEGLWSASNPEVMTNAVAVDKDKEKQDLINEAVAASLRDPEVAKNYLKYATPEVKAAINKALDEQFKFEQS